MELQREYAAREPPEPHVWWLRRVCEARFFFQGTALCFEERPEIVFYFLLAKLSPRYQAAFLQASFMPTLIPPLEAVGPGEVGAFDPRLWEFDSSGYTYVSAHDIPSPAIAEFGSTLTCGLGRGPRCSRGLPLVCLRTSCRESRAHHKDA